MRFMEPVFVLLTVAAFHCALSASLESAEKDKNVTQDDGLTRLQKIDQIEFESAQKDNAAQMNVTEEQSEEDHDTDQMVFESAQKDDAAQMNVTEQQSEEDHYVDQMVFESARKDDAAQMNVTEQQSEEDHYVELVSVQYHSSQSNTSNDAL